MCSILLSIVEGNGDVCLGMEGGIDVAFAGLILLGFFDIVEIGEIIGLDVGEGFLAEGGH